MAEKVFLMLNGIGLVFLVFVFVEFLKEGHRTRLAGVGSPQFRTVRGTRPGVVVAVAPPEDVTRFMRRRLIQFRAPKDAPSESKLARKPIELDSTLPWKGYGTR